MSIIGEIKNYRKVLKSINTHKNSIEWSHLGLRSDWIGRIYKVINLPKEYEGDDILVRNSMSIDMAKQYRDYIGNKLKLNENVFESVEVKSKRSYLYVWSPIFNKITVFNVVSTILVLIIGLIISAILIT